MCKQRLVLITAILSFGLLLGCQQAEQTGLIVEADRSAIRDLIEAERQANLDGDVDAFMALRAPDFTAMPPGMLPVHGTERVREFIAQSVQEGSVTELRFTTEDLRIDGDLGVALVNGRGSMQLPDGAELNATLSFLFVARRGDTTDGRGSTAHGTSYPRTRVCHALDVADTRESLSGVDLV